MTAPVLTARQHEILALMAEGLTAPEIAARMWLGYHTVRTHQRRLYARLGAHTGPAAVAAGYRLGLLTAPAS